jgi:tetratricopeptide (TPR) repeat protein
MSMKLLSLTFLIIGHLCFVGIAAASPMDELEEAVYAGDVKTIFSIADGAATDDAHYNQAQYVKAAVLYEMGKYQAAIDSASKVIAGEYSSMTIRAYGLRSAAKKKLGDVAGAEADARYADMLETKKLRSDIQLSASESMSPEEAGLLLQEGLDAMGKKQFERAIQYYDAYLAIEGSPNKRSAYASKIYSQEQMGNIAGAIETTTAWLNASPDSGEAYQTRARLRGIVGDQEGQNADLDEYKRIVNELKQSQIAALNKAIEANPSDTLAYFRRAKLYLEQKDFDAAQRDLDIALEQAPDAVYLKRFRKRLAREKVAATQ